jgi:hypothetical protein
MNGLIAVFRSIFSLTQPIATQEWRASNSAQSGNADTNAW